MKRGSCPPPWTSEFVLGARTPILSNILGSYGYFRGGGAEEMCLEARNTVIIKAIEPGFLVVPEQDFAQGTK